MESTVSETERPAYLANVLSIAKADKEFTPHEAAAFKAIAERIGASQDDVDRAWKLHQRGENDLRFMHAPRIRMANMQDMITMALADGGVGKEESAPIEKLAGTLKYSQADMDMMVRRAEQAIRKLGKKIAEAAGDRKESAQEHVPPEPPAEPPSQTPPSPTESEPAEQDRPEATEQRVPRRKPSAVKPYTLKAAKTSPHKKVPVDVAACVAARGNAEHPCEYCFGLGSPRCNVWGCRLLEMDWMPGSQWLTHGHFRQDDTFVHDQDAIACEVHAQLPGVRQCPHVNEAYIARVLEVLPRRSNVSGHWTYRPAPATDRQAHLVVSQNMPVSCLDPKGTRQAVKVIRRALRRAQRSDVNVRLLR